MRRFHFTFGAISVALVLLFTNVANAGIKEQMSEEMLTLAQEMQTLKPNLVNPTIKLNYDAKLARYRVLSQQLGGDDPGNVGIGPIVGRSRGGVAAQLYRDDNLVHPIRSDSDPNGPGCCHFDRRGFRRGPLPVGS
jgi:hypothetical protein